MPRAKKSESPKVPRTEARDESRARQVEERRKRRGLSGQFEWGDCDAAKVLSLISAVTNAGFTCQFGFTKDGGAGVIRTWHPTVKLDDIVIRPTEDSAITLDAATEDFA
jgi:hypothetical protein